MAIKVINLSELDKQPLEVREAIAFYTALSVLPIHFSSEERQRHYNVLENAGYIDSV